ncbi:MAG TPA: hypothetical protein DCZ95_09215 [Verrucomicrobia bacterium]|nr:hypothetical protein [Verrucomicrobiota bacterium]
MEGRAPSRPEKEGSDRAEPYKILEIAFFANDRPIGLMYKRQARTPRLHFASPILIERNESAAKCRDAPFAVGGVMSRFYEIQVE